MWEFDSFETFSISSVTRSQLRDHCSAKIAEKHFRTTRPSDEQKKEMGKKYDSFLKANKKRLFAYLDTECKRQKALGKGEAEAQTKAIEEAGKGGFRN